MKKYMPVILHIIPALILVQTLYFKYSGTPESVYIFETLGLEPHGRIGSGIAELIAAILLLIPKTAWAGAGLSLGIISGAIIAHLSQLGTEVQGDGGYLFFLAVVVFVTSAIVLRMNRKEIPVVGSRL
ncbi:MAG TPA: DoxX family protein [Bacteroidetes bacterium]|nr:DoxX family protein [Bacteroidota bacterium]